MSTPTSVPEARGALASLRAWSTTASAQKLCSSSRSLPRICEARQQKSQDDVPIDTDDLVEVLSHDPDNLKEKTVLYLAYGSNLSDETFLGARGIRPLSQINVLVPALVMTFDLPGIAYKEPCFANVRYRTPDTDAPKSTEYHKDRWHKALVGTVYEVTLKDYAHIIQTEGGGAGYQDVLVDCYALDPNPRHGVPETHTTTAFKAHTLFDPAGQHRTDPSYAQPSARYLKLITDGAMERNLPYEYQDYLHQIRPYRLTTNRQLLGQLFFMAFWGPIFMILFKIVPPLFAKPNGRYPKWLANLLHYCFGAAWISYDKFYKPMFGDGERTIGEGEEDLDEKAPLMREAVRRYGDGGRLPQSV